MVKRLSASQNLDLLRSAFVEFRRRLADLCDAQNRPSPWEKPFWNDSFKDETSLQAVRLLRSIEVAANDALTLSDNTTKLFATRLVSEVDAFRVAMEGLILVRRQSTDQVGKAVGDMLGLNAKGTGNSIVKLLDSGNYCGASTMLTGVRAIFYGAIEDIKMIY